jgi:predicted adenylyl cyclase CyaB
MKNIEIEARSFITKKQYKSLLQKLREGAKFIGSVNEETVYFSGPGKDLRIRRDDKNAFIILKEGRVHDDSREEIEIKFNTNEFKNIEELFKRLGYRDAIRWFRKRRIYKWGGVKLFLDDTKGYGLIIELEKLGKVKEKGIVHRDLESKLKSLGIKITPKSEFNKRFKYYKNNWRKILKYKKRNF